MNRNNRVAIIIANVTQINEPILKAKRMGQVNDATIEKRLALGLRKSFRWQQNYKQRGATFATLEK